MCVGKGPNGIIIGGLPKQTNTDNANHINIGRLSGRQRRVKLIWIKVKTIGFDFGKNRNGPHGGHHFSTGRKGK